MESPLALSEVIPEDGVACFFHQPIDFHSAKLACMPVLSLAGWVPQSRTFEVAKFVLLPFSRLEIFVFLVGYVEERLWWPIQSPNIIGGKKKASS